MKHFVLLIGILSVFTIKAQSGYRHPKAVAYDAARSRYLVSDAGSNYILSVVPGSAPTLLLNTYACSGLCIVGDSLYICGSNYLKIYNLANGSLTQITAFGTFVAMCYADSNRIFLTHTGSSAIFQHFIGTNQLTLYRSVPITPTGITYDASRNRLLVVTATTTSNIYTVDLNTGFGTSIPNTALANRNGISLDQRGNCYVSCLATGRVSEGIYVYDSTFTSVLKLVTYNSGNKPFFIYYSQLTDTLAIPIYTLDSVQFYRPPFPLPFPDYRAVAEGDSLTICVIQNDVVPDSHPLYLKDFSPPAHGTADTIGNCIKYVATNAGIDTITYTVCTLDTPQFCSTGILQIFVLAGNYNHAPIAMDDYETTPQFVSDTFNIGFNDLDAESDTLCISSITASARFTIDSGSCTNIIFTPDSFFLGTDTCFYIICDNDTAPLCDTAMLVVTANRNQALLPVASFNVDFRNIYCYALTAVNTSSNYTGTPRWVFTQQFNAPVTLYGDTAYYLNLNSSSLSVTACVYVSNAFGSDSACNSYVFICEGIANTTSATTGFTLYPNPAKI